MYAIFANDHVLLLESIYFLNLLIQTILFMHSRNSNYIIGRF